MEANFCPVLCVVYEGNGVVTRSVPLAKKSACHLVLGSQRCSGLSLPSAKRRRTHSSSQSFDGTPGKLDLECALLSRPVCVVFMRTTAIPAGVVPTGDLLAQRRRSQLMRRRSTFAGAADLLRDSEPKKGNDASGKDAPAASTAKCVLPLDYSLLLRHFWCLGRGWEVVSAAHLKWCCRDSYCRL